MVNERLFAGLVVLAVIWTSVLQVVGGTQDEVENWLCCMFAWTSPCCMKQPESAMPEWDVPMALHGEEVAEEVQEWPR